MCIHATCPACMRGPAARVQRRVHACKGECTHAKASARMQRRVHACNGDCTQQWRVRACKDECTHAMATAHMQWRLHTCKGECAHAKAAARMQRPLHGAQTCVSVYTKEKVCVNWQLLACRGHGRSASARVWRVTAAVRVQAQPHADRAICSRADVIVDMQRLLSARTHVCTDRREAALQFPRA